MTGLAKQCSLKTARRFQRNLGLSVQKQSRLLLVGRRLESGHQCGRKAGRAVADVANNVAASRSAASSAASTANTVEAVDKKA
jgi:hypothetical protein